MSWLEAADVAVHQHLHIKHMFKCDLEKRQQNVICIICRATGCSGGGGGGCSGRRLGFSQGKPRESLRSREVEDIQHARQGVYGQMLRGITDIPWPST